MGYSADGYGLGPASPSTCVSDLDISNTTDIGVCFSEKNSAQILLNLTNSGLDTISNVQIGWFFSSDQNGVMAWTGNIYPNSSELVSIPTLSFPSEGHFSISLWVTNGQGDVNSANDSISINVHVYNPFIVNELKDTAICTNAVLPLGVSSGYHSYSWGNGDSNNVININEPGEYRITVSDEHGCEAIDSMSLDIHAAPSALLPGDTVLCDGVILATNLSANFITYQWANGSTGDGILIEQAGIYSVQVMDTNSCIYTDTMHVQYAALPTAGTPTQINICNGDSTVLDATNSYNSYVWNTGDTSSSITITSSGNYIVTVTGPLGCIGIDTIQVIVNPLPEILFNDSVMCNLDPFVMDVGWFPSYQWSNGSTSQNPIITTPGLYSVTVTDLNGCESVKSVYVNNYNVNVDLGPDTSICSGDGNFILLGNYDSYVWNDGDTSANHWIGSSGIYSVTVTNGACAISDEMVVVELLYPNANFSHLVTSPNVQFTNLSNVNTGLTWDFGDGTYSTAMNPNHHYNNVGNYSVILKASNVCDTTEFVVDVSIFPQDAHSIYVNDNLSVFPTIAETQINFTFSGANKNELNYSVYDVSGRLLVNEVQDYFGPDHLYKVDVSSFAAGTYYIRIVSDESLVAVQPFIKK
jgi:hypothetical protein